jgi:hypothetical protein
MTTGLKNVIFQIGNTFDPVNNTGAQQLNPGDWGSWKIKFATQPQSQFQNDDVVVMVTPSDRGIPQGFGRCCAAAGVVYNADKNGCTIRARNSDKAAGIVSFNWLAVQETNAPKYPVFDIRAGVVQPQYLGRRGDNDSDNSWDIQLYNPFLTPPHFFLTESNLNHFESYYAPNMSNNPNLSAIMSVAQNAQTDRFKIFAHSSDIKNGTGSFNYIGVAPVPEQKGAIDAYIDTGILGKKWFGPDENESDWQEWNNIYFKEPFLTPPIVLATPYNKNMHGNAAPVGIVRNVTTHGFTLSARNSSSDAGEVGFYWLALGCSKYSIGMK